MDLQQFLAWLASGTGASIAATWLFARWGWYNGLEESMRKFLLAITVSLIGLAAYGVVLFVPIETIQMLSPYFAIVAFAFTNFFVGNRASSSFRKSYLLKLIRKNKGK